ncbi:hypothetical protein LZ518_11585 [Sphingomonas sp. RB56-2]|uniref:ATP-binding protein n=1 Tax=Sphingomonas brevis TaxID=2908206 RepID=A0ABT0SBJ0_9SPHN|nr:hypothetical protein [Sphingomonas brevis]MCL6741768.1 hypothetical protein [Sphingomonas brevis]
MAIEAPSPSQQEPQVHQIANDLTVYVTGGGGTHLEPRVTTHYLAAMIAEAGARGMLGTVTAVKTQQSELGAPLDDLVIDGRLPDGTPTRLDLQITTSLSFTESDDKWQDIIPRAWDTFRRTGFNAATDRIGVAVSQTTTKLERSIQPLLARARHAADASQFRQRLAAPTGSNNDQREFQRVLEILVKAKDPNATDDEIIAFLRCFTIVAFDLDQEEASRDRLGSLDRLAPVAGGPAEAKQVLSSLTAMASRIIPSGGGVDRATVVRELQAEGHTIGSDRAHVELINALDIESRLAVASIRDTIGGKKISRDALLSTVADARVDARLLRIVGQHGTGKSALLKLLALDEPAGAPILVLRDLRVTGGGWPAHVQKFGKVTSLETVLREFGLCGSRTLFIDGADKMDPAVQITINDLLKAIADTPDLDDWRVVMTMREENAQRVDGWLDPEANSKLLSTTIRVEAFDDGEAGEAAKALPLLRPLLADPRNYDTVLRRPFFLDALSKLPVAAGREVRSEVDLVELWWEHGGVDDVDFAPAQGRRNVLLALGEQLLVRAGQPMAIRSLDPVAVDELLQANVLRNVDLGVTVAFAHDIYEEWILERLLRTRQGEIAQALRDGGEDLQLARPLQLLAAVLLERSDRGDDWAHLLGAVGVSDLRATWSRVVLAAPVRSVHSQAMLDKIEPVLLRDDAQLLGRLILSVRTTETVRDLRFLDEKLIPDLTRDEREQYASEGAGPEIISWMRLISWLAPRFRCLPAALNGELLPLLDAWVTAIPAALATYAHVPEIAAWALELLGDGDSSDERDAGSGGEQARALLLKCTSGAPAVVRDYLSGISDRAIKRVRKQIVGASASVADALAPEMTDFIERAYFLDHDRRRDNRYSSMREQSETLGFDDTQDFYPASPLRPPFLQLLRADPEIGLGLIRRVCNHAMEGWRRSWRETGETPIPIAIDLGEGPWEFWGDDGTYRWFRGGSHVHMLDTALLALDAWAHERASAGDAIEQLCLRIASGNECNAVLGICAGLCFAGNASVSSHVSLAIGTHPALWQWDLSRQVGDTQSPSNEIGYWGGATVFASALRALNRLPHRERTVRDLAVIFAGLAPDEVRAKYAAEIAAFLDRIPYATAEERDDPSRAQALRDAYEPLRQQADPANLVTEEIDGKTYISMKPPYTSSEKHQAMLADHAALGRVLRLYLWAVKAVEDGKPGADIGLEEAYDEMVSLDADDLFDDVAPIADMRLHNAQSAVSATAAVLARHAKDDLWAKAEAKVVDVTRRAATIAESRDEFSYRGSHVSGHPPAMAANAFAALLQRDPSRTEWRAALLQLAVDPIDKVVEAVYDAAPLFAEVAPDMVWRLFCLATQRAARTQEIEHGLHWSLAEAKEQSGFSDEAESIMAEGVLPSPHSTPATAGVSNRSEIYYWNFHANALKLQIEPMLDPTTRDALIEHAAGALEWGLASLGKRGERGDTPYEWLHAFGRWLGRLIALLPTAEVRTLLIARLNAAEGSAPVEVMDIVMSNFMIDRMLRQDVLDAGTLETWELLVDWAIARPGWSGAPLDARQHDRGMAISSFYCAIANGMVCGIDKEWPNLDAAIPALDRAATAFSTEQTAFTALLALLRARSDRLLPQPGLDWIQRVVSARKTERKFWSHASNGERLVLLLRELVAAKPLAAGEREIVVEAADTLIEMGVKGAAFLQQDLVRPKQ